MLTSEISPKSLHKFVDWLPECEWEAVHWTLAAHTKRHNPWLWKMMTLPEDDEEETEEERLAVEEAKEDLRAGRVYTHEEAMKRILSAP